MEQRRFWQAIKAGIIAWIVFPLMLYMAPLMRVPKMDVPAILGGMFGVNSLAVGWMMHLVIGLVLALIYAYWFVDRVGGVPWMRGLTFSVLPWLAMMIVVAPMQPRPSIISSASEGPEHDILTL
jgi:peptidoglycan/LPS O-acetylase OafA/YrhL